MKTLQLILTFVLGGVTGELLVINSYDFAQIDEYTQSSIRNSFITGCGLDRTYDECEDLSDDYMQAIDEMYDGGE